MGNRENVVEYRAIYEQSVCMLVYNIMRDITSQLTVTNPIKFKKENKFKFNGKNIDEISLENDKVVIVMGKKSFKVDKNDKTFSEFSEDPYNFINLYESIVKELKD